MNKSRTKGQLNGAKKTYSDESVLSIYLREINRIPLLSREEEEEAARAAAKGNKAAREKLVRSNLRFVVNIAKKFQGRGLPLMDLISEGNIGLINAIKKYDVDKGYHFISYAVWWIRQSILRAICEKGRMIRLPLNRVNELVQIEQARKLVQNCQSSEAEYREIGRFLGMDSEHVAEMINIGRELVSLEMLVSADKDATMLMDFIEDDTYQPPDEQALDRKLHDDLESVLGTLDSKEADILRCRYGLMEGAPMTLKEVGDHFNVTKERIRQIEKKALKRLQVPDQRRLLEAYVA
ncbi:MAG: RNA polymerase sigma factor RpoD/SigA [Treponema sp.]|nr:RNA polymerase sigma factor RpoD/SigA [Treponema sp.]